MQALRCLFYALHVSTHFLHHIFSKMLFLLGRGGHIFAKRLQVILIKDSLFWPSNGLEKSIFCNCICSFRSFGRSDCHLFAPCPLQNIASGCSPVYFSPPESRQWKWMYASQRQFCQFRIRSAVFFVPSMLRTFFFYKISSYFLKICSPPSVGSMILKAA